MTEQLIQTVDDMASFGTDDAELGFGRLNERYRDLQQISAARRIRSLLTHAASQMQALNLDPKQPPPDVRLVSFQTLLMCTCGVNAIGSLKRDPHDARRRDDPFLLM